MGKDEISEALEDIIDSVGTISRAGEYEEALSVLTRLIEICPERVEPYLKRAEILAERGRISEALQTLEEADRACPGMAFRIELARAEVFECAGMFQECIKTLRGLLGRHPDDAGVLLSLGRVLSQTGEYAEAARTINACIRSEPGNVTAWSMLGTAYYHQGMYEDAVRAYDVALAHDPTNEVRWYNKANALLEMGRYSEAVLCYDTALEHDMNWVEAWNNRGVALDRVGMLKDAERSFLHALNLRPEYTLAQKNITIVRAKMRGEIIADDWFGLDIDV